MNLLEKCCFCSRIFLTDPGMVESCLHLWLENSQSHTQRRKKPSLGFLQENLRQGAEKDLKKPLTSGKRVGHVPTPSPEEGMLCWANSYVGLRAMTICN